jgi:hypothetical protein
VRGRPTAYQRQGSSAPSSGFGEPHPHRLAHYAQIVAASSPLRAAGKAADSFLSYLGGTIDARTVLALNHCIVAGTVLTRYEVGAQGDGRFTWRLPCSSLFLQEAAHHRCCNSVGLISAAPSLVLSGFRSAIPSVRPPRASGRRRSQATSPALLNNRRSCPSSRLLWRVIFTVGSRDEQSIWTRRHGKPQACDQRPFWSVAEGKAQQGSRSDTGCATAPEASGEA